MVTNTASATTEIPFLQRAAIELAIKAHAAAPQQRGTVCCPMCEDPEVHILGTGALQDDYVTVIGHDGLHEVHGVSGLRDGYCVFTIARCGSGCTFGRTYQYHRGQVFTRIFEVTA